MAKLNWNQSFSVPKKSVLQIVGHWPYMQNCASGVSKVTGKFHGWANHSNYRTSTTIQFYTIEWMVLCGMGEHAKLPTSLVKDFIALSRLHVFLVW